MSAKQRVSQRPLVIGFVNNASYLALQATERRFAGLLRSAGPHLDIQLKLFRCPELPRPLGEQAAERYADIAELFHTRLDALIVTGMEPQAAALEDEPIWANLVRLAGWADDQGVPTIWSCLAAHAAVRHLDGIDRSRLPEKLSGVFGCEVGGHPLTHGIASGLASPHSRLYGLQEERLVAAGYLILSKSAEAGADIFVKCRTAPFVFVQGHPEYETDTLLREYKRDVRRYIADQQDVYPALPKHYFDPHTEAALGTLRDDILNDRSARPLEELSTILNAAPLRSEWLSSAAQLFANWLACVVGTDPSSRTLFAPDASERDRKPALAGLEAALPQ